MTFASSRTYAGLKRKLQTAVGRRFSRFVSVAVASLAATQIALTLLVGVAHVTAGTAGVAASAIGAAVSYVLSRWAWERKGRPSLLRETIPFWAVSAAAWCVLGLASHYSSVWATSMGLPHWERVGFIDAGYFVANTFTFLSRFLIFHYLLFADRGSAAAAAVPAPGSPVARPLGELAPFAVNGPPSGVNGPASWGADGAAAPESGVRR